MSQTQKDKLKALEKIRRTASVALRGGGSPAMPPAFIGALIGGVIGFGLGYVVQAAWLLAVGCFVGGIVGFRVAKYKTWGEYIYVLLAAYHPEDKTAYAELQKKAAERALGFGDVMTWAAVEKERLTPSIPSKADQARCAFVEKSLS